MSSTYYVRVRNRKILASRTRAYFGKPRKADFKNISALLKPLFNIGDLYQKNDYYRYTTVQHNLSVGDRYSGY